MLNKSIAYRLSVYISLAVVAVFVAFIAMAYAFNSRIVKSNIENKAIGMSVEPIKQVEIKIVSTKEVAANIANQALFYHSNNNLQLLLSMVMEKYPHLNAIHIEFEENYPFSKFQYFHAYRNADSIIFEQTAEMVYHCQNEKKYFDEVKKQGVPDWTKIFECNRNHNMVISYFVPIPSANGGQAQETIGSVICELSLDELNSSINSLRIGKTGYAFLVSREGNYITHPNKEWIYRKNLYSLKKEEYRSKDPEKEINLVLTEIPSGSGIVYPEYLGFKKSWVYFKKISETGWTLIFIVPYNEIFVPLYLLLLRMMFFAVLGILLIFMIITYITNKLIAPLSTVTSQLKRFSSRAGDNELATMDEVQLVSESLHYLKEWYVSYRQLQTQEEKKSNQRKLDLSDASEIQRSLIKLDFTEVNKRDEIALHAIYKPARTVSGDLFDFNFLDDENMVITIGDVSGKGVPASLFMSIAQTVIKSNAKIRKPAKIVNQVNNELYTTNQHQFFLTLFLAVVNLKTGVMKYCNAAHTATYILKSNGELTELRTSHGMPLGLYPEKGYAESKITLQPGDIIVFYTDGVSEAQNENKVQFGDNRMRTLLADVKKHEPEDVVNTLENAVLAHKGNAAQTDDITILAVKYKGTKKA